LERLVQRKIALWDVCASAERVGSLDSSILVASVVPNDFRVFLHAHGDIRLICFNGGGAERLFGRLVLPRLAASQARIPRVRLPSTSPAHAGMKGDEKLRLWRDALGHLMSEG
jgi:hypoxanthine-DNA glycosylase